jgi:hypothetical protein
MPIVKETSARLYKRNITHDAISREVAQSITNPVALAIYTYLLTKPEAWVVRRQEIFDHFGIGRHSYDKAMNMLKDMGLVWVADVRGDDGRLMGKQIVVEQTPSATPNCMISRKSAEPTVGSSDHLEKKRIPREEEIGIRGWDEWVQYRKELKKPMTPSTVNRQVKQLENHTPEVQQAMITQSIEKGWTGLFEIKEKGNGQNRSNYRHDRKGPEVRRLPESFGSGYVIDG